MLDSPTDNLLNMRLSNIVKVVQNLQPLVCVTACARHVSPLHGKSRHGPKLQTSRRRWECHSCQHRMSRPDCRSGDFVFVLPNYLFLFDIRIRHAHLYSCHSSLNLSSNYGLCQVSCVHARHGHLRSQVRVGPLAMVLHLSIAKPDESHLRPIFLIFCNLLPYLQSS